MNEQDKKRVEEIVNALNTLAGGRRNGKTWYLTTSIGHLLDIIARQDAERKEVCVGCVYKGNHNFYLQHFSENDELRKDRNRLAAECKAKEQFINELSAFLEQSYPYAATNMCAYEAYKRIKRFREGGGVG